MVLVALGVAAETEPSLATVGETCNSFDGKTPVLLANGAEVAISKVKVGDKVLATDPATGVTGAHSVQRLIVGKGHKNLVDVTLAGGSVVTATDHHPFWDVTTAKWTNSMDVQVGDHLLEADGHPLLVTAMHRYSLDNKQVFNLTVADVHTYYAGAEPVLVHNSGPCLPGQENPETFSSLNEARSSAIQSSGLGENRVPFVQQIGPDAGRVTGMQSPEGTQGWRLDWDSGKGFHVNWWDRTGGLKRIDWNYGANSVAGGTWNDYQALLEHFPSP